MEFHVFGINPWGEEEYRGTYPTLTGAKRRARVITHEPMTHAARVYDTSEDTYRYPRYSIDALESSLSPL